MKIYEIDQMIESLIDPETGELMDFEAFEQLQMERDSKIEGMALWYKEMAATSRAIREEELELAKRRRTLEKRADGLKDYIGRLCGGEKFQTTRCVVSFRKTTRVEIYDESAVVEYAQRNCWDDVLKYAAPTVAKDELTRLLKDGYEVPGADLVTGQSTTIK